MNRNEEYISFRDLAGKDHHLRKSLYKGMDMNIKGQMWVLFGKSRIEICKCEFRRVFMQGFLGVDYLTEKSAK